MVSYQYSYLIGDLALLFIWFILFLFRKDVRKQMIIMSLIIGILGMLFQFVYSIDWWHPLNILGTKIGLEDFLFGFAVAGIASVIYEEIFHKKIKLRKVNNKTKNLQNKNFILISAALAIFFFGSFYLLGFNSFYSSIFAFIISTSYIYIKRNDLIYESIISGALLMIISFIAFIVPEFITPGWINSAWYLQNLSGIIILHAPIEDLIWFLLAGAYIGPLYEYWREGRLVDEK
jgi:hypothetical protein